MPAHHSLIRWWHHSELALQDLFDRADFCEIYCQFAFHGQELSWKQKIVAWPAVKSFGKNQMFLASLAAAKGEAQSSSVSICAGVEGEQGVSGGGSQPEQNLQPRPQGQDYKLACLRGACHPKRIQYMAARGHHPQGDRPLANERPLNIYSI